MLPERIAENLKALERTLVQLLEQPIIRLDNGCRRSLPELPGIYRILDPAEPVSTIRADRADVTLRQRIYSNHIMGDQNGNLRAQLVRSGVCPDKDGAKHFIRQTLAAQFLPIADGRERIWIEHFILAALRPRFSD